MRKLLRALLFLILLLLIGGYFLISWQFSSLILQPQRKDLEKNSKYVAWQGIVSEDKLPRPKDVSVKGIDDIELKVWYFGQYKKAECAVILIHGWGSNKEDMLKYADLFWDCGCDIIAYDHRAHGSSDGDYGTGGIKEKEDLIRITQWTQNETGLDFDQIAWVGASWGAATAIQAGPQMDDIAFILADSPFQDWETAVTERALRVYGSWVNLISPSIMFFVDQRAGVNHIEASPLIAAKELEVPVFLIHSKTDYSTGSIQSVNISNNLDPNLHVFHHTEWGAGHTKDINERPEEFRKLVYEFMDMFKIDFIPSYETVDNQGIANS